MKYRVNMISLTDTLDHNIQILFRLVDLDPIDSLVAL